MFLFERRVIHLFCFLFGFPFLFSLSGSSTSGPVARNRNDRRVSHNYCLFFFLLSPAFSTPQHVNKQTHRSGPDVAVTRDEVGMQMSLVRTPEMGLCCCCWSVKTPGKSTGSTALKTTNDESISSISRWRPLAIDSRVSLKNTLGCRRTCGVVRAGTFRRW